MANNDKRTASALRAASVRRATTRSWGVERLEERTVLSAAGSALLIYVVDLSDVRGWDPPTATKAPTQGNSGLQKSVVQLDNATIVFVRGNAVNRRGPSGGEDGPEGEASSNVPVNAVLKLRAPETISLPSLRAPVLGTPSAAPQQPAFSRETSSPADPTVDSSKTPKSPLTSTTSIVQVVAPSTSTVSRPVLSIPVANPSSDSLFADAGLSRSTSIDALTAHRGEQVLGQSGLLQHSRDAASTNELADPQISYETEQASDSHTVDGTVAGDEVWQFVNRTKRLRYSTPSRLKPPAVHAALQQLICQFPSTETWACRLNADPASELAEILTAEAARTVALPNAPQMPEEEGGAVTLSVDEVAAAVPVRRSETDSDGQDTSATEVVSLQDVVVRMEFSAERYQAFDVSTEPTQATDPCREVAVNNQATGN
jgi:hypothetical protein